MRDLPNSIDSKYRFISIAAKRCEMLQKGATPKKDYPRNLKFTIIAMDEVLDDLIAFETFEAEDAVAATKL